MAIEPKHTWHQEREHVRRAFDERDQVIKQLHDAVINLNTRLEQLEQAYMEEKLLGKTVVSEKDQQRQEGSLEDQRIEGSVSSVTIVP